MAGRHVKREAPAPGDEVVVEFVDAPVPDTREIMVIPPAGIPLRLRRDGVEYALTEGHPHTTPITYDYYSVEGEPAGRQSKRRAHASGDTSPGAARR